MFFLKWILGGILVGGVACKPGLEQKMGKFDRLRSQQQVKKLSLFGKQYNVIIQWEKGPFAHREQLSSLVVQLRDLQGEPIHLSSDWDIYFEAVHRESGELIYGEGDFFQLSKGTFKNTRIRFQHDGMWRASVFFENRERKALESVAWPEELKK